MFTFSARDSGKIDTTLHDLSGTSSCPTTGKLTLRNESEPFSIPGGQARWWRCSACNGWHTTVECDKKRG